MLMAILRGVSVVSIRDRSFIYHLTSFENVSSILRNGLLPRAELHPRDFADVADAEIIEGRMNNGLETFVPFHWFSRNPFDGRVQADHPETAFVLIAVYREHARDQGWQVIPRHPLAGGRLEIMAYEDGINAIDWELMDQRDYSNAACRHVCMAECLSPAPVPVGDFAKIFTPSEALRLRVVELAQELGHPRLWIEANPNMFSTR
ncbi:DarT ssDNA thymidine ADP-ribosyltransferase family protein [Pseudomonas sp. Marseille-P9899]|uniref:DarT ssDNA thymidine ADP-ribosyltransferase family protein n=1 Tax=Pseudomonas sp. Marseille-P9899 TaxID=2730401 RepID=UPI002115B195|nr:DarT ssDNA thymidine ADP-ribosyltransferase family protein [Pseudomonas sp. Marseille-P9899]